MAGGPYIDKLEAHPEKLSQVVQIYLQFFVRIGPPLSADSNFSLCLGVVISVVLSRQAGGCHAADVYSGLKKPTQ